MSEALRLFGYWRAAAPWRVRIALGLKGLAHDAAAVNLAAGAQHEPAYAALNPQRLTPTLETPDGALVQSLAILEWLEETYPRPALLPSAPRDRARVRAMAQIITCDIHPLNNLRVLQALRAAGFGEEAERAWIARWIHDGFRALEPMIAAHGGEFAFGSEPGFADCCLVPQVYSARRFGVALEEYPRIRAVVDRCAALEAFRAAHAEAQPDARP